MLDVGCITDQFKRAINLVVLIVLAAAIIQLGISLTRDIWHAYLIITLNFCTWWPFIWYTTCIPSNNFECLHLMNSATHPLDGFENMNSEKLNLTFIFSHSLNALYDFTVIMPYSWSRGSNVTAPSSQSGAIMGRCYWFRIFSFFITYNDKIMFQRQFTDFIRCSVVIIND